jgi:uncharacterized protein (DUF3084 family)
LDEQITVGQGGLCSIKRRQERVAGSEATTLLMALDAAHALECSGLQLHRKPEMASAERPVFRIVMTGFGGWTNKKLLLYSGD